MKKLIPLVCLAALTLSACGKAGDGPSPVAAGASPSVSHFSGSPATALDPSAGGPAPQLTTVQQGLSLANEVRRQNGLPELTLDPLLSAVAQAHAEDMLKRHYFEHETPEGITPFQRMQKAGVRYNAAAENIAMGTNDAHEVFQMWLGSPGHRHNLLNKVYGRHGIGFAGGYWVHDFCN